MYTVIGHDGKTYGPVDLMTVEKWISQRRMIPDTLVIDAAAGETMRAGDILLLKSAFERIYGAPAVTGMYSLATSYPKSKATAIVLAVLLGWVGVHRYYLGDHLIGSIMLMMVIISWAGALLLRFPGES